MKKFILFLAIFSAIFLTAVSPGGTGGSASDQADYFYIHPFNTNQSGLFQIAEKLEPRNVFLNIEDVMCMAKNIFFEAAVESTAGKLAVAQVTLNRVKLNKYPNTICDVVYEGNIMQVDFPKGTSANLVGIVMAVEMFRLNQGYGKILKTWPNT